MNLDEKLNVLGLKVPEILFPKKNIDLSKFACIAVDQHSHNIKYWNDVEKYVGDEPSTFNLIYPEAYYLKDLKKYGDEFEDFLNNKLKVVNDLMKEYLDKSIYESIGESLIYVERTTSSGVRKGLLVAVDLEKYDYTKDSKSLIRATEFTVVDRLLVRKKIRENAVIDLPHALLIIDDKKNVVFDTVKRLNGKLLYNFDLMMGSGNIKGYMIDNKLDIEKIIDCLISVKNNSIDGLLYGIGDGNHSLAAAKDIYKKTGKGRYALVEIVNIYDEGLKFFPIHRLLMNADREDFMDKTKIDINNPIPLQDLQILIDGYVKEHPSVEIEYIHGKEECLELGKEDGNIAIVYDEFSRDTLFDDVVKHGSLCRKSFSMGEAKDKRFYLEGMKIV